MLSVIMLSVIMLSVIMLSVIMLSVIMLSVIMLSVFMLNVVTLCVMETYYNPYLIFAKDWIQPTLVVPQSNGWLLALITNIRLG